MSSTAEFHLILSINKPSRVDLQEMQSNAVGAVNNNKWKAANSYAFQLFIVHQRDPWRLPKGTAIFAVPIFFYPPFSSLQFKITISLFFS
jgi:hypothetical protein